MQSTTMAHAKLRLSESNVRKAMATRALRPWPPASPNTACCSR
jgi:hypothetical protein